MDWTGNKNSIFKTLGASNHTDKERDENDFYATDPIAIDKLLKVVSLPTHIWECSCGQGHLSERLKQHGYDIRHALDILPEKVPAIFLLKTTALEGKARYDEFYRNKYLKYVFQFTERLLCAKNAQFDEMKAGGGSAVSYAWFWFEKGNTDDTMLRWI